MNGWTNSDTWRVTLNLSTEERSYLNCRNKDAKFIEDYWQNRVFPDSKLVDSSLVNWEEVEESFKEEL